MNKKLLVLIGVIALGIGAISTIALQSRAQNAPAQPAAAPIVTAPMAQENTAADADNVQNDPGGIEKPDVAISPDTDKETNDDQGVTSTVKQADTQERGEGNATDTTETEDGN
jgi:hypothetical protein